MNRFILIALLGALCAVSTARAQDAIFVNPGVKLGYTFGDRGGFTLGLEVSVTAYWSSTRILGATLDYDYCGAAERHKFHLGAEGSVDAIGLDVGPTWVREKGRDDFGATITPYFGLIAFPYYSLTILRDSPPLHEAGVYGKLPLRVYGLIHIL
jgi:hypothetical protein